MEMSAKNSYDYYNRNLRINKENTSLKKIKNSKEDLKNNSIKKQLNFTNKNYKTNFDSFQLDEIKSRIKNTYKRDSPSERIKITDNDSIEKKREKEISIIDINEKKHYDRLLTIKDSEIQSLLTKNSELKIQNNSSEKERNLLENLIDDIIEKYEINYLSENKLK